MSISFVGGTSTTNSGSATLTYSPTSGNFLLVENSSGLVTGSFSCKDSLGNYLLPITTGGSVFGQFIGYAVPGQTSFSLPVGHSAATIAEYSGVYGIGAISQIASHTATSGSVALNTTAPNSWVTAGFGIATNLTYSIATGNLREQAGLSGTGQTSTVSTDNTAASPSSVTNAVTWGGASETYFVGAEELLVGSPPTCKCVGVKSFTSGNILVTSEVCSYAPVTIGNYVVLQVTLAAASGGTAPTSVTCVDNNSNPVPLIISSLGGNSHPNLFIFVGKSVTGATSYTVSWTGSNTANVTLEEYANVVGVGASFGTSGAATTSPSISLTPNGTGSTTVGAFAGNITPASTSSPSFYSQTASSNTIARGYTGSPGQTRGAWCVLGLDYAVATTAGVAQTLTVTSPSQAFWAVAVELYSVLPPVTSVPGWWNGWGAGS